MSLRIIYGPPGTGKTTYLLDHLEKHLALGVHPNKVGFISFTRKAAYEARDRAILRFGFTEEDTPHFRTIHSLAFKQLGLSHHQVMQKANYLELADKLGIEIQAHLDLSEGAFVGSLLGDRLLFVDSLARLKCLTIREQWEQMNDDRVDWHELNQLSRALAEYKKSNLLLDYTDMLDRCYTESVLPNLDVLFLDEAQDLSPLQWRVVERLIEKSGIVYIAGDDDQAIFTWAGADVDHFINLEGDKLILDQSYRIPECVHELAGGIVSSIERRAKKVFKPRDGIGSVQYHPNVDDIDYSNGEWLCLARSRNQLYQYERLCKLNGYHYEILGSSPAWSDAYRAIRAWKVLQTGKEILVSTAKNLVKFATATEGRLLKNIDDQELVDMAWLVDTCGLTRAEKPWEEALTGIHSDDIEYFLQALATENLDEKPRIKLSTIHGTKGGEAQNVAIMTDVYSRVFDGFQEDPDNEHRVFYVGVTRTKENLHVIVPKTSRFYPL